MADLYVLEGRGFLRHVTKTVPRAPVRRGGNFRVRRVPGIVYGDPLAVLLGKKWYEKAASVVASPVKLAYTTTKAAAKATVNVVKKPTLTNLKKVVTAPTTRAFNESKSVARDTVSVAKSAASGVKSALDVTRRVAKRLIKKVAKKVLFKGDDLLGSVSAIPKNAAKGVLIPVATAAVLANTITAPAAPAVPVLVNEVINELYSAMENAVKKGLSPEKAAKAAQDSLDVLEPGEENDPKVGFGSFMPIAIGVAFVLGLVVVLKKK